MLCRIAKIKGNPMSNSKYVCPECGSSIVAWADLDAQIIFKVNESGNLINQRIENLFQSDGRCGVQCSKCDWKIDDISEGDDPFFELANEALKQQEVIKSLSAKRD